MKSVRLAVIFLLCTLFVGLIPRSGQSAVGDIVTVAGGGTGDNRQATAASLLYPSGVAVDGAGNIYLADQGNNRVRKVSAATGIITTVAGNGTGGFSGDNGAATEASLYGPAGVAVDSAGDLYVADRYNNCIRKVSAETGIITTVAGNGTAGYSGDNGAATAAALHAPTGVAVDSAGNLYVADHGNNRIRKVWSGTGIITTVAGNGSRGFSGDSGAATAATLNHPFGVAVDGACDLYIADQGNNRIRKVSAETGIITSVAGNGTARYSGDNGAAIAASLNTPSGIAVDGAGNLYVADASNDRVRKVAVGTGIITTVAGNGASGYSGDKGTAVAARMNYPAGVAVDGAGNLYVADQWNYAVRKVSADTGVILTVAGGRGFSGDNGAATAARFTSPERVAVDGAGHIYIADSGNNRIRKISAGTGIITTVAGNGTAEYAGDDGLAAAAGLNNPSALAVDGAGNLYIADRGNNRIRKVAADSGIISTVAWNGAGAYSGDNGAATEAGLNNPSGVTVDGAGNLYIADRGNNRVRKVLAENGMMVTVAGNGTAGYSGDSGAATAARLHHPTGVALDGAGNLYIADQSNHRVRKVAVGSGIITTVAGNGTPGFSGDDGPAASAMLHRPNAVAADSAGNLYVVDENNLRIRKVSVGTGIIATVAGNGKLVYAGDDGAATAASLAYPSDVAVDGAGQVVVADTGNNCIRVFEVGARETETGKGTGGSASTTATTSATVSATTPLATASVTAAAIASAAPTGSYIYDSFTASSTVTLENHVGETGSTWKRIGGAGDAWIDPTVDAMYTKSDVTFANLGSIPTADYSVIANLHCYASAGNSGVNGRASTSGAPSRYFAIFTQGLGWGLYYADGFGTETRFGPLYGPRSLTAGRDYKVELRVKGSSISMYVDGVLAASGTSTKNAAAGRAGFETTGSGPGKGIVMLDFQVAALSSGGTTFTLNYSAGPNGTISGSTPQTVTGGGSGTQVTAVANTGYHFVSWSDGVTTASRTDTNVTSNISVTASFAVNTTTSFTLTYSAGPNGTISGATSQTVPSGGSGTQVTAVPNTGYAFVSWSDGATTASRTDTNVTRNISVTASFALISGGGQTTYIYDSFTSSSTATLETHTGETGSTWTRVGGSGSASIDPANGGVYSSTSVVYGNTGTVPTSDYSVIATIRAFSPAGGTNIGVNGRLNSGAPSRYLAVFTQGLGWGLYYSNGLGTLTRMGALFGPTSLTSGQIYTLELRMIGSTISMYVNGVLAATGSNTANSAAGRAGIEIAGAGAGAPFEMLDFRVATPGS